MSNPDRNPLKKQPSKTSLEQRLQMISTPQQAPITIYPGPSAGMANLSKADLEIAQRLENLRKSEADVLPTEEEMASRLAQLKGLPSDHYARSSAAAAAFQPPDQRTAVEKTQDLLSQAMQEVALDARIPNPDDELQARLARLRGEEPRAAASPGAVALPPAAHQFGRPDVPFDDDLDDMSLDEVEALMQSSAREAQASADAAMGEVAAGELAQAVAQATRKKEKKGRQKKSKASGGAKRDSSDDERRSKSYDSDIDIEGGKAIDAVTDQAEVQRIIDMYTKRAQLKKERKRKKKEAAAAAGAVGGAVGGDDSDSDISSASDSDLTSESEKFSESDELSD